MELGKAGGVLACYPGGGGRQARGGGGVEEEDASPHRVREDRDYNDKCTRMTMVGEEDKPEEGEEIELRKGKEVKEGRVVSRARKEGWRLEAGGRRLALRGGYREKTSVVMAGLGRKRLLEEA